MKRTLVVLTLTFLTLLLSAGPGVAQQKGTVRTTPADSAIGRQALPQQTLGEVTSVDPNTGKFTVKGPDVQLTLRTAGPHPQLGRGVCICGGGADSDGGSIHINWGNRCPCKGSAQ